MTFQVLAMAPAQADPHGAQRGIGRGPRPTIDAVIHPKEWTKSKTISITRQSVPNPGNRATLATTVYLQWRSDAIYVAFDCRDPKPSRAVRSERDSMGESDWVAVGLDPFGDRRTGFWFQVNAAGTKGEGRISNDSHLDMNWDHPWQAAVRRSARGWTAELRIPWSSIQYPMTGRRQWGVQLRRFVSRLHEVDDWSYVPRGSSGFVSNFARIQAPTRPPHPMRLSIRPYLTAKLLLHRNPSSLLPSTGLPSAGFYVRYGPTSSMSLDVTVNPDFGQVEMDPAVVNLTNYETYFPEKRPFFLEDAGLFATPITIAYTRRIGAPPALPTCSHCTVLQLNETAPVWLGVKMTGRPAINWRLGTLLALVGPAYALVEDDKTGFRHRIKAAGLVHFAFARAERHLGRASQFALAAASVQQQDATDVYVLSLDTNMRDWAPYTITGQLLGSLSGKKATMGWGDAIAGGRTEGSGWQWQLTQAALSRNVEVNRTGYFPRNDLYHVQGRIAYLLPKPTAIHRSLKLTLLATYEVNHLRTPLQKSVSFWVQHSFTNMWSLYYQYRLRLPAYDDWNTYSHIPLDEPIEHQIWWKLTSDPRLKVNGSLGGFFGKWPHRSWRLQLTAGTGVRLGRFLQMSALAEYSAYRRWDQWVETDDQDRPIFGSMDMDQVEMRILAQLVPLNGLSIQLFAQYVYARATFGDDFFLIQDGGTRQTCPHASADWSEGTLRVNLRLRWEFTPGSNLYLSFQHNAVDDVLDNSLAPAASLHRLKTGGGDDLVMVKLDHRWVL